MAITVDCDNLGMYIILERVTTKYIQSDTFKTTTKFGILQNVHVLQRKGRKGKMRNEKQRK